MLVSYELKDEPRTIYDQETSSKIKRNKNQKEILAGMQRFATRRYEDIAKEQVLINTKRAEFGVYLVSNSLVGDKDPYTKHFDVCITAARLQNREEEAAELVRQKAAYITMQQELRAAVAANSTTVLGEDDLGKAVQYLKNMPIFGQALSDALDPPHAVPGGERFRQVPEEPETKKSSRFRWSW
jgi:hypothetical protein